jgi:hypothetical protein
MLTFRSDRNSLGNDIRSHAAFGNQLAQLGIPIAHVATVCNGDVVMVVLRVPGQAAAVVRLTIDKGLI